MPKNNLEAKVKGNTIHIGDRFSVNLHRTLRIPDDDNIYPLPPSLGHFPIARIDDYRDRVPASWREHGGVFFPMWQREAMWMSFNGALHKPNAVKVGVGKVDALSGKKFSMKLHKKKQDYMVVPGQSWLDGINAGGGHIKQFVAMPLGMGYTVEGQITGEERFGGIQLVCFDPVAGRFPDRPPTTRFRSAAPMSAGGMHTNNAKAMYFAGTTSNALSGTLSTSAPMSEMAGAEMGLAAGGRMKQKIYSDEYGVETWDIENYGRLYIHIVNSQMWKEITGEEVPPTPVSAATYTQHGFPWFDIYDEDSKDIRPADALANVKSVKEKDEEHGFFQQDDETVSIEGKHVHVYGDKSKVRDGKW